ncbi:MAG: cytochrome c [Polyangiaceae bacterium]
MRLSGLRIGWGGLVQPLILASAIVFSVGCDRAPDAASLREWTPTDHHSPDDKPITNGGGGRQAPPEPRHSGPQPSASELAQLVDVTWRQQCVNCHGPIGRGDGQLGPMVNAPDLTDPRLQNASDEDLLAAIKGGKNKMPPFNLPEPVLRGLVARVRSLRVRQ